MPTPGLDNFISGHNRNLDGLAINGLVIDEL